MSLEDVIKQQARINRGAMVKNLLESGWKPPTRLTHRNMHRLIDYMRDVDTHGATLVLSPVEVRTLVYISHGFSGPEIANEFGQASDTVKQIQKSIKDKMGAGSLPHAVRLGFEADILRKAA